jgi:methionine biosynthesis protein metW
MAAEQGKKLFMRDFSLTAALVPFCSYDVYECSHCGMVYAGNIEESMPLADYYAILSRYEGDSFVLAEPNKQLYAREVDFLEKHTKKDAKILDIGCAFGGLLSEMQRRGFTSLNGLELSAKNCAYAHDTFGISTYIGGLGKIPNDLRGQKFDIVILSDVLEHIFNLREAVVECRELLSAGGLLYIVVPDMEQFPNYNDFYQEFSAEHINYFDLVSLRALFSRFGMKLVSSFKDKVAACGVAGQIFSLWRSADDASSVENARREHDAITVYLNNCSALAAQLRQRMESFDLSKGIYIWGAATLTAMLFQEDIIKAVDIRGIVDSNRNYHGQIAYGHEIAAPESLRDHPDVPILISSQYAQEAIARTISEQMKLPNPVLRLFDAAQSTS